MIAIVDYGMGNLRSVANAFRALGEEPRMVTRPEELGDSDPIVLPGVGAFGEGMQRLRASGLVDALDAEVRGNGRPFIGLCLGMQLLASEGREHGIHRGLGWVEGTVDRLPASTDGKTLRVPHVGWNDLEVVTRDGLLRTASASPTYYFVHSYVLVPRDPGVVSGYTTYGVRFASTVEVGNIFGTQFHPEKSQRDGLALLGRFLELAKATC